MPSPFPGMDPYLESHWGDVHTRLTTYASDQLLPKLPSGLIARIEEFLTVTYEDPRHHRTIGQDVRIVEGPVRGGGTTAVAEPETAEAADPLIVPFPLEEPVSHEIRIHERSPEGRLITVIEFLSLANRRSGREQYLKKQAELMAAGINLVEIDLLRMGPWIVAAPQELVAESHRGPYRICVTRGDFAPAELYQASYKFRLPNIRIPLRYKEPDVLLELQPLLDQAYKAGYARTIDYRQDPVPPLPADDREWLEELLKKAGLR